MRIKKGQYLSNALNSMVPINSVPITNPDLDKLGLLQSKIDNLANYSTRVATVQSAWNSKPKSLFGRLRKALESANVASSLCQYCGWSEETDIEHVFPKSHFPERTFVWENYLLACSKCNSRSKKDQFAVFDPVGTDTVYHLSPRKKGVPPVTPPTADALFINPRIENPLEFLILDPLSGRIVVKPQISSHDALRAEYTRKLVDLNRDRLTRQRRAAWRDFSTKIRVYEGLKNSRTVIELENVLTENSYPEGINAKYSFEKNQRELLKRVKNDIIDDPLPLVWEELRRQQPNLFNNIDI